MAYDNVVSALGKICHFHCDNIDASEVSNVFMHSMLYFLQSLNLYDTHMYSINT
jgi:hypothetical protein